MHCVSAAQRLDVVSWNGCRLVRTVASARRGAPPAGGACALHSAGPGRDGASVFGSLSVTCMSQQLRDGWHQLRRPDRRDQLQLVAGGTVCNCLPAELTGELAAVDHGALTENTETELH